MKSLSGAQTELVQKTLAIDMPSTCARTVNDRTNFFVLYVKFVEQYLKKFEENLIQEISYPLGVSFLYFICGCNCFSLF